MREFNLLMIAVLYYTRIQVPWRVEFSNENQSRAYRYFPLVGMVVGALASALYIGASYLFPHSIAVMMAMGLMILTTGALHEDGFADLCDGFGAGRDKESRLRIMKDSYIGVFGVVGLITLLLLKFCALSSIPQNLFVYAIIAAQGVSRLIPLMIIKSLPYARIESSKVPHAQSGISWGSLFIAAITALAPLYLFGWIYAGVIVAVSLVFMLIFRQYIKGAIGGYTGDTLGAAQQICEVLFYLSLIALCSIC